MRELPSVRPAPGRLSTRIEGEWTFRSAHTETLEPIPALAVRFAPDLDDHNAAPAGRKFRFRSTSNATRPNSRAG